MSVLLIQNGLVVTEPLAGEFQKSDLRLESGIITHSDSRAHLDEGEETIDASNRWDASGCWILPGLTDAHTHLYGALANGMPLIGDPPRNFPQVLESIWWRLDKALGAEDIAISALVGGIASLKAGITSIFDHHASPTCPQGSLETLAIEVKRLGLRASLAYEVSDRDGPLSRDAGIEENRRFFLSCQSERDPMLKAHFGIHAVFSVSDQTMRRCAEIGNEIGAGFHLHVLEHRTELEKFVAEHQGQGVIPFLSETGILGPRTIAAHTVHLSPDDISYIANAGAWTVHNPKSNMGNGVGVSPIKDLLQGSVRACLGSDGFYDLPQQMVTAPLLQTLAHGLPSVFGTGQVLHMVYGNNAALAGQTFGLPFGKLKAGYAADALVIPYDPATPVTQENLGSHILAALAQGPRDVIIGGEVRMKGGVITGVDESEVYARSRRLAAQLWARM